MSEWHPSLTHVEEWDKDEGTYTHITIDEAKRKYPKTVSASDRIFHCSLCGKYVALTREGIPERYFKHEHDETCSCPDKIKNNSKSYEQECQNIQENCRSLPLYLKTDQKNIWFEIGFFRLDEKFFSKYWNIKVRILTEEGRILKTYWLRPENFGQALITHISIGSECSKKYVLEYLNPKTSTIEYNLSLPWKKEICGIDPHGTIFDRRSGKRVPDGACVEAGREYWLLTKEQGPLRCNQVHICENIRIKVLSQWHLYQIFTDAVQQDAADFFRNYHLFLTASPERVTLLWPVCSRYLSEHIILYTGKGISLLHYGERTNREEVFLEQSKAETEDAPEDSTKKLQFVYLPNCAVVCMPLAWIRQNKIYQYAYLLKDSLQQKVEKPEVHVSDLSGSVLTEDDYCSLPPGCKISVCAPFDGFVEICENNFPICQIELKSGTSTEYFSVHDNWEIRFYQGLDCVRTIFFRKKNLNNILYNANPQDMELLRRLQRCNKASVPLPHSIGCIADKLADYPLTKRWIYTAVRKQSIPEDALLLVKYFLGVKNFE